MIVWKSLSLRDKGPTSNIRAVVKCMVSHTNLMHPRMIIYQILLLFTIQIVQFEEEQSFIRQFQDIHISITLWPTVKIIHVTIFIRFNVFSIFLTRLVENNA